ncbi:hypothetical protein COV49_01155 [Candidatus Falkowbacteria bacterium CG11_big_fil_rev_8_21_14_0_20_39_10]|uniref:Methyltransferase n=1 Tax=Candidatus Falkowbacteria bacterium CG11_big_fil_rev_8_21_14_0_20_39_10 TaxID=1974570 RepID=A0A2M6KA07_9BACT|nr:MAG: hypothetical protein COV49_01155 [Candidatus Falkowbacteria bacterium CG11_big_fil_rev_8_21_14_0_20_39_10]
MTKRNCPICGNTSSKLIYKQRYSKELLHNIESCKACGFVYVSNSYSQEFYNKYYKDMSKYEDTRDSDLHEVSLGVIRQYLLKNDEVLDIGCSTGHLLHLLKKKGYNSLLGLDPAPRCKEIAKEKYDVNVVTDTIESFKNKRKFDFVILATVLEHLEELKESLKKISSLVSDEGKIFISVPNAGNFYQDFEEPFGEFSTEHINFFSSFYLQLLLPEYSCMFIKSDNVAIFSVWQKITSLKKSVDEYIKKSTAKLDRINRIIDKAPNSMIIWGAGSLTMRLLQTTDLRNKVDRFVDRNLNMIGKSIDGIPIISPEDLENYNAPILISSYKFKNEIVNEIKKRGLKNKILTF